MSAQYSCRSFYLYLQTPTTGETALHSPLQPYLCHGIFYLATGLERVFLLAHIPSRPYGIWNLGGEVKWR